ncbi:MAG: PaaI family thioesterase [Quisquiliibacterium sp.]
MSSFIEELNRKYIARAPHMRDIGASVTALGPSRGSMRMPARADWLGDPARGLIHPGALTVLADSACGLAVGAALGQPKPYATLDLRMDYLRPATPARDLNCDAECYRLTRSIAFVRASVWQDSEQQPVASAQATFMLSTAPGTRPSQPGGVAQPLSDPPSQPADSGAWAAPLASEPVMPEQPIPYAQYLGIRVTPSDRQPLFRLPYQEKLVGNPRLPALHGGVIAGFSETAAILHLAQVLRGEKLPKGIDFSIDYLRSGRPAESFASCELVRVGSRIATVQIRCWQSDPARPIAISRAHFLLTAPDAGS